VEMFGMARDIAALLGRRPATADQYRRLIGKPTRA
jgi:3-keto-5-aminohexanoate cleavage enzyme